MALLTHVTKRVVNLLHRQLQIASFSSPIRSHVKVCCDCRTRRIPSHLSIEPQGNTTRHFYSQSGPLRHGDYEYQDPKSPDEVVNLMYIDRSRERIPIRGKVGDNVMYLAHRHDIEIEGACEASLACCTCHVVLPEEYFNKLPEIEEEEEDMLDLAPFLTPTSRLSCQIILSKELEGMEVSLPQATRNFYVDGHVPQPH